MEKGETPTQNDLEEREKGGRRVKKRIGNRNEEEKERL